MNTIIRYVKLRFFKKKVRIFIDLDDTLCHFSQQWRKIKSDALLYPQSKEGFFLSLEPIDGAIETYKKLEQAYDVWILTAPSYMNPLCYTEKRLWVEKYLGLETCKKLVICYDKSLLRGDYLIDDTNTRKQLEFKGKFLNFGKDIKFKTWNLIAKYFKL